MSTDSNLLELFPSDKTGGSRVCISCLGLYPSILMFDEEVCNSCNQEAIRKDSHACEAPCAEELWNAVKYDRNKLLDSSMWAVLPDSPLSDQSQIQFKQYRAALHRITVDFTDPSDVVWPQEPALVYKEEV